MIPAEPGGVIGYRATGRRTVRFKSPRSAGRMLKKPQGLWPIRLALPVLIPIVAALDLRRELARAGLQSPEREYRVFEGQLPSMTRGSTPGARSAKVKTAADLGWRRFTPGLAGRLLRARTIRPGQSHEGDYPSINVRFNPRRFRPKMVRASTR